MRLHFENTAGYVEQQLLGAGAHAHLARLHARNQRRVPRQHADLAHDKRRKHHFGRAGIDLLLGTYDVNVHCHGHVCKPVISFKL